MTVEQLAARLGAKKNSSGWQAKCPAHADNTASLSIKSGDGGKILVFCHAGCDYKDIVRTAGVESADFFSVKDEKPVKSQIVAKYDYCDEQGGILFQALRYEPKAFRQRRPNGSGWEWSVKGIRKVPYRLPELLAASLEQYVYIVEGEKDVERLSVLGLAATCNAGGAGKWQRSFSEHFKGRKVAILSDNDDAGRKHARDVESMLKSVAVEVRIIELPGLPDKGDVSDWLDAGGDAKTLLSIVEKAIELESKTGSGCSGVSATDGSEGGPSSSQLLVEIARKTCKFAHSPEGTSFVTNEDNGREITMPLKSKMFRAWWAHEFWKKTQKPPSSNAIGDALSVLDGLCTFDGAEVPLAVRIAKHRGALYYDLGDDTWRAVKITAEGWEVVQRYPVSFRRPDGLRPSVVPVHGGSLDLLDKHVTARGDDLVLIKAWLVGSLRTGFPFPLLLLLGFQGSGKSGLARLLRALLDPNASPLRSEPKSERDLGISTYNNHVLAFDNLSKVPQWLSDALCRIATGGGFVTRALYSDTDETIIDSIKPVLITGITEVVRRPDLLERTIVVTLPSIDEKSRKTETECWSEFEKERALILGAMFDAVSCAIKNYTSVTIDEMPRMADFSKWATAAEPSMGMKPGTVVKAFNRKQADAIGIAMEASLIANPLHQLARELGTWKGSTTDLLAALKGRVDESVSKSPLWPKNAEKCSSEVSRMQPYLKKLGVKIEKVGGRGRDKRDWIVMGRAEVRRV